jgi:hypothetical protein
VLALLGAACCYQVVYPKEVTASPKSQTKQAVEGGGGHAVAASTCLCAEKINILELKNLWVHGSGTWVEHRSEITTCTHTRPHPQVQTCGCTRDPCPSLAEIYAKKKYKPVVQKIHPVLGALSDKFRIKHHIIGSPLANMPQLNPNPPKFVPTSRYTAERCEIIDAAHSGDFLWPE